MYSVYLHIINACFPYIIGVPNVFMTKKQD